MPNVEVEVGTIEVHLSRDEILDIALDEIHRNEDIRSRILDELSIDSATVSISLSEASDLLRKSDRPDLASRLDELQKALA